MSASLAFLDLRDGGGSAASGVGVSMGAAAAAAFLLRDERVVDGSPMDRGESWVVVDAFSAFLAVERVTLDVMSNEGRSLKASNS